MHCTVTQKRIGRAWKVSTDGRHYRLSVAFDGMPIYVSVKGIPDAIDEAMAQK